jgi:hypothetical protein
VEEEVTFCNGGWTSSDARDPWITVLLTIA